MDLSEIICIIFVSCFGFFIFFISCFVSDNTSKFIALCTSQNFRLYILQAEVLFQHFGWYNVNDNVGVVNTTVVRTHIKHHIALGY
jgi:hypothetical protein